MLGFRASMVAYDWNELGRSLWAHHSPKKNMILSNIHTDPRSRRARCPPRSPQPLSISAASTRLHLSHVDRMSNIVGNQAVQRLVTGAINRQAAAAPQTQQQAQERKPGTVSEVSWAKPPACIHRRKISTSHQPGTAPRSLSCSKCAPLLTPSRSVAKRSIAPSPTPKIRSRSF